MKIYVVKILDISEEKLDNIYSLISREKEHSIKKMVNKKDKIRTLIGEILIRTIIMKDLGENRLIILDKNQYGKPYLRERPDFNFNISHSGDFVVCAIDDKPIGIDIEEIKDIEYKNIAECFFTISEFKYIANENLDIGLRIFMRFGR